MNVVFPAFVGVVTNKLNELVGQKTIPSAWQAQQGRQF